jgi:2-dehydro-3-deoxygalactonokinase
MIAIDWGTSSLRVYRLDRDGAILESRSSASGILAVEGGAFAQALEQAAGDWIASGEAPILMSGMIGSRQGWVEAPYAACPAGVEEIGKALREVRWKNHRAWIAPGLSCRDASGVHDVMRGEEVQILGVLDELGAGSHRVCLPGTHSKWVTVSEGRIVSFATYMTGEVYAVLKAHSILGRQMSGEAHSEAAFADGIARSADGTGLLHHLFGVRARGLFGELDDAESASYLSGLLIGHELRTAAGGARFVNLLCTAQLGALYARAGSALGIQTRLFNPDAVTRGLHSLAAYLPEDA